MTARTLHITNAWHERSGGIRTFYRALMDQANEQGRFMRLVVPGEVDRTEAVGPFARIHHVAAPHSPVVDRRYRLLLPHRFVIPGAGRLWRIIRDERPDVVEVCDKYSLCYLGGLLRKVAMTRRPAVVGLSCERMDDNMSAFVSDSAPAHAFARWYIRTIYVPQADVHIANSPYTAEELVTGRRPVYVAPMGVDVETFSPDRRSADLRARITALAGGHASTRILLYAGRLSAEKNVSLLIDMLPHLPERHRYRLLLVGDGPERASIESRVSAACPDLVRVQPAIDSRAALAELLANVDVFVHPNPREPFGIAPLEAMASGVPVVLPDRGGVRAYASHENAWLASAMPAAFAAAVANVEHYPALRAARVACARATAERHRWSSAASTYFRIYDEVAQAHRAGVFAPVLEEAM